MINIKKQAGFIPHLCENGRWNRWFKQFSKGEGFTLVEVIISTFIFSLIVITISGLFVRVLSLERRAFASQKIQENGLFIMELVSREIRVSQIENQDSDCNAQSLTIVHPINGPVTYSLINGILKRTSVENGSNVTTDLSSSDVVFSNLKFCIKGSSIANEQVRVAIIASIQNKIGPEILTANLETTVSSRDALLKF